MSVSGEIMECLLRLSGASKDVSEREFYDEMRKNALSRLRREGRLPHFSGVKSEKGVYCGMNYYLFVPTEVDTPNIVMYLHGSGYVNDYRRFHLHFAADLARNLHAKVYFPLYPKLPLANAISCFALLNNFYAFLYKKGEVCLIGDSSGASLALALASENASAGSVVAISPWVLLNVGEEGRQVRGDVVLSMSKLDYTAELWKGDLKSEDVRVSPFYGNYAGKDILLFAGEKERFRPDILRFLHEHASSGAKVTYIEGREAQHCYPLMPTAEGKRARGVIYEKMCGCLYGEKV